MGDIWLTIGFQDGKLKQTIRSVSEDGAIENAIEIMKSSWGTEYSNNKYLFYYDELLDYGSIHSGGDYYVFVTKLE